jgi:outer membrane protein
LGEGVLRTLALLGGLCLLQALPSHAESLQSALNAASRSNPRLVAERARLSALTHDVTIAGAARLPRVETSLDQSATYTRTDPDNGNNGWLQPRSYGLSLSQQLFDGFRTDAALDRARAEIAAAEAELELRERDVLGQAARTYFSVLYARRVQALKRKFVDGTVREVAAAKTRLKAGELTVADIAQAESRLARAKGQLAAADGDLEVAALDYERVIGHRPSGAMSEVLLGRLPRSVQSVLDEATQSNPAVLAARSRKRSAAAEIQGARAGRLPKASLDASYRHTDDPSQSIETQDVATITGRVSMPLYDGGETAARVLQGEARLMAAASDVDSALTEVRSEIAMAFARLRSADAQVAANKSAVQSAQTAAEAIRQEREAGQRTLSETLTFDQELLDARIALLGSERDDWIARYALLGVSGRLAVPNHKETGSAVALSGPSDDSGWGRFEIILP